MTSMPIMTTKQVPPTNSSNSRKNSFSQAIGVTNRTETLPDRRQHGHEAHDSVIILGFSGSGQDNTMYAVIKSGGKQYRVESGAKLRVEALAAEVGANISFEEVLLVGAGDGVKVGAPFVSGALVKVTVVGHGRDDKVRIFKLRRRKHFQKSQGHRQSYTELRIDDIIQG